VQEKVRRCSEHQEAGRRLRDDQWIDLIFQLPPLFVRTIDSAPAELIGRPLNSPVVVLVPLVQATSPSIITSSGLRTDFTARANAMSLARW
jgi:hypothetical protein